MHINTEVKLWGGRFQNKHVGGGGRVRRENGPQVKPENNHML